MGSVFIEWRDKFGDWAFRSSTSVYFVYSSSKGSGESAQLRRLNWAFVGRQCDKYQNSILDHFSF